MVEWYRYADNRKKIVNFCSYIIRGSLAKLYAAKYKLRSRAKVYKIGARNLSRPLKEKKGQSPDYHNLLRMGLAESIDGLQYTRMSLVPETDYSPFPCNWRPDHEKALMEYIRLDDSRLWKSKKELHSRARSCVPSGVHFNARLELQEEYCPNRMDQLPLHSSSDNGIENRQLLLGLNLEKKGDDCKAEQGDERLSSNSENFSFGAPHWRSLTRENIVEF
ncbi:hypothetical protein NL676_033167 [Syzygium grande]|nr:hypothetical protein NL676_033167 [Syzygium grande]